MEPTFFETPDAFRAWLEAHHAVEPELLVGFRTKSSGRPSITWDEAVDQALCFGWIDGIRRRVDTSSYTIRFTPRRKGGNWSRVNVERVARLSAGGLMRPAGTAAFESRSDDRTGVYSYENRPADLPDAYLARMRADVAAWTFWRSAPPSYRRAATWWVISAKQEETRERRLTTLVECSSRAERLPQLRPLRPTAA